MNGKIRYGLLLCGFLLFGEGFANESAEPRVQVVTVHGDTLTGELIQRKGEDLQLKSYWLDQPLNIDFGEMSLFKILDTPESRQRGDLRLVFPSGNLLMVKAVQSEETGFVALPTWGGELQLPENTLKRIEFLNPEGLLYFGPMFEGTEQKDRVHRPIFLPRPGLQWETENIKYPQKFVLEIEMETETDDFLYHLSLFDWKRRAEGAVVFEVSANRISSAWYQRISRNRMTVKNWREAFTVDPYRQHLRFFVNLEEKTLTLKVNGEIIETWKGEFTQSLTAENDSTIGFRYMSGTGQIKVSSIRIMPWEGTLPDEKTGSDQDRLTLKSGRSFSGEFKSLNMKETGFWIKEHETAEFFPNREILSLDLIPRGNRPEPRTPAGMIKLFFVGERDPIKVSDLSYNEGLIHARIWTGAAPVQLSVPLTSVQQLEFSAGAKP